MIITASARNSCTVIYAAIITNQNTSWMPKKKLEKSHDFSYVQCLCVWLVMWPWMLTNITDLHIMTLYMWGICSYIMTQLITVIYTYSNGCAK